MWSSCRGGTALGGWQEVIVYSGDSAVGGETAVARKSAVSGDYIHQQLGGQHRDDGRQVLSFGRVQWYVLCVRLH